jgi:hypothetical protein
MKAIKINKVRDARRLLSKLIYEFQTGEVTSEKAKTLSYLLNIYIQIFKVSEFETKIEEIEKKINEGKI